MAKVAPFPGVFYRSELGYQDLLAPPYDVISPQEKQVFLSRSPYNVVRLILPESILQAKRLFHDWLEKEVLAQDREPSFYWCRQDYRFNSGRRTGRGLIALLGLEELKSGSVYPHEETIPATRQEQFQLLGEVEANFCPIITLYRDEKMVVESVAAEQEKGPPFITYEDDRKVRFSLWKIRAGSRLLELFAAKKVFIADGHHRYSSAYQHFLEKGLQSSAFILTYFLNSASNDTLVLPFHRYLAGVDGRSLLEALSRFRLEPTADLKTLLANLSTGWIGLAVGEKLYRFSVPEKGELEVVFLHRCIINKVLNRNDDQVSFDADAQRILERTKKGGGAAFFLPGLAPGRLLEIWEKGFILPRKSTYFYPKIPSGLVIYKHN